MFVKVFELNLDTISCRPSLVCHIAFTFGVSTAEFSDAREPWELEIWCQKSQTQY